MTVRRYADPGALARAAADELAVLAGEAVAERMTCHLALSGGSTPKALFAELAARGRDALPWDQIEVWWVDERCVPPMHADSNFGAAREALLEPLAIDPSLIHRIRAEQDPEAAARGYEEHMRTIVSDPPVFDVVLLGMGADGHTASLFPGVAIDDTRYVVAVDKPGGGKRITMTPRTLNAARHVRFLVAGADKADTLGRVLQGAPDQLPAQRIQAADLAWLVDDAAARALA